MSDTDNDQTKASALARARDDYYVFQDNYYVLKNLAILLRKSEVLDKEVVDYIISNNIDVNSYLTTFQNGHYIPIIYQCSLLPNRVKLFKYLVSKGAKTRLIADGPHNKIYDILFSCHDKYLKYLVKHNKTLSKSIDTSRQIRTKLIHGNYRRVFLLNKLSVISEEDITNAMKDHDWLILETIKTMIDRLGLICRTHNVRDEVDHVINKYLVIFGIYIKYLPDLTIPYSAVSLLVKYYQHKVLALLSASCKLQDLPDDLNPIYHADMNPKNVAVLRLLFNDLNYAKTCDVLEIEPDDRCY